MAAASFCAAATAAGAAEADDAEVWDCCCGRLCRADELAEVITTRGWGGGNMVMECLEDTTAEGLTRQQAERKHPVGERGCGWKPQRYCWWQQ